MLLLKMRGGERGSLSIVSCVGKVNYPFAPNVGLFGSDVCWDDMFALSHNRFIWVLQHTHTHPLPSEIIEYKIHDALLIANANLCSFFFLVLFLIRWGATTHQHFPPTLYK